jgi:hypothetical protein
VELNVQKGLSSAVANTNLLGINNFLDQVVDRSNSNFFFPENKRSLLSLCGYYLNDQLVHVGRLGTLILHAIAIL